MIGRPHDAVTGHDARRPMNATIYIVHSPKNRKVRNFKYNVLAMLVLNSVALVTRCLY